MPRLFEKGNKASVGHGRPKVVKEFRLKCRAVVDELVVQKWIDEVRRGGDDWVKCSELLANYGYGKPTQPIEGSVDVNHLIDRARELPQSALDRLFAETAVEH